MSDLVWRCERFDALSLDQLYAIMVLRQRVFVVEQTCVYLDCDGWDEPAWHLWGTEPGSTVPVAYSRILPPNTRYPLASIGRVISAHEVRGRGLGQALMRESIARAQRQFGAVPLWIGAQLYLQRFYEGLGFVRQGEVYDEDGIPHVHMLREGDAEAGPRPLGRERVRLRPLEEADVDPILTWVNDPEVVGNLASFSGEPFTREQELAYVRTMMASKVDRVFSVLAADDGRYLGQVGLHQIHRRSGVGRLACIIGVKAEHGKGFGTAAIASVLDHAFGSEGLHKVWAMVFETNARSRALNTRIGFRVEGRLREEYFHEDGWHTMVRMGLLASDWKERT